MIWLKFSNRTVGCPRSRGRSVSFSECSTKQVHTSLKRSCYPDSTICLMWQVGFRRPERKLFQGHIKTISLFARQNRKLTIDIRLFGRLITLSHRELVANTNLPITVDSKDITIRDFISLKFHIPTFSIC